MTIKNRIFAAAALGFASVALVQGGAQAGTPGVDGAKTITAAGTVVNAYDYLISATAGSRTITVNNIANLEPTSLSTFGPGSVVLLYQANGVTIDSTDTSTYGTITNGNQAGYYEFVTVGSISGNVITIAASCSALQHTYTTSGATGASEAEIVRVPQYSSLTINSGASITAPPWSATENTTSGSTTYGSPLSIGGYGGIVAIDVEGTTTINGSINVAGGGFLGGDGFMNQGYSAPPNSGAPHTHAQPITDYVFSAYTGGDAVTTLAAMKGESIAGNQATLDLNFVSRYGRGAPANGGGGGNGHNNGGGGGANGNNGNTWYGVGLLDTNYANYYANATGFANPLGTYDNGGFSANNTPLPGTPMSIDSGGGRGGYSFADPSRTIVPTNEGGLGGRPLGAAAGSRIFFGGGGGAGDDNDSNGGSGGNGGGIVLLNTGVLAGSGSIVADGAPGDPPNSSDGAGGGGGGGSVVVLAGSGSISTISANGGAGGNELHNGGQDDEGTGGGGGGGFVAAPATTITVNGGAEGMLVTGAPAFSTFPPYGATLGTTGMNAGAPTAITYCYTPVIGVAKNAVTTNNKNGTYTVQYTVYYQNYGDTPISTFTSTDALTSTFPTGTAFTVTTAPALTSISTGSSATVDTGFNGNTDTNLITAGTLLVGGTATVTFSVTITPPVGSQTYSNTAIGSGKGVTGNSSGVATTDQSDSGTNPDPAGLGNPGTENTPTTITITGQPTIVKTVRNVTTNEATGLTADTAKPGDQLEYTLSFTNGTGGALSAFTLTDLIPTNTTYKSSACGALALGVTACSAVYSPPGTGYPNGKVTYTLTGSISNSATQTFTLDVTVN